MYEQTTWCLILGTQKCSLDHSVITNALWDGIAWRLICPCKAVNWNSRETLITPRALLLCRSGEEKHSCLIKIQIAIYEISTETYSRICIKLSLTTKLLRVVCQVNKYVKSNWEIVNSNHWKYCCLEPNCNATNVMKGDTYFCGAVQTTTGEASTHK